MWIGKKPVTEMAELLGTSTCNVKRAFRGQSLWFKNGKLKNNPELVRQVTNYYRQHGRPATVDRFPDISVKSIIDRPEYYGLGKHGLQIRWTDDQIIEAVKMCGLISFRAQAIYFNRPGANEGSIKALYVKRFDKIGGSVNGMVHDWARHLVNQNARYLRPIGNSRKHQPVLFRKLILWVDMEEVLKPEVPTFIKEAIHTMADFQRWLWRNQNPKPLILKMIKERERLDHTQTNDRRSCY